MKSASSCRWSLVIWALVISALGGACHRAPQTAAELRDRLPRRWQGEVQMTGEKGGGRIGIELRELTVRSEHVLEFNRVRYQVFAAMGTNPLAENEVAVRGTITTPGGEIRLEEQGTDVGEMLKAGTFQGMLDGDLQSVEATWTTGTDQKATLKLQAAPK